jgi:hypothetical protein
MVFYQLEACCCLSFREGPAQYACELVFHLISGFAPAIKSIFMLCSQA